VKILFKADMLDVTQNVAIVIMGVACSLFLMAAINYYWPAEHRRVHNDLIGWQLSILGTTYAVILGFMLYTVWVDFGSAELNAEAEANSLDNLYRLSDALQPAQGRALKALTRAYGDAVVYHEWPEMAANIIPAETRVLTSQMWVTLTSAQVGTPTQITALDHAFTELGSLSAYRRIRMVESAARIPGVLWFVLLIGACVTIASTCLFGASNGALHVVQVIAFSSLITLGLAAIADINRPYQGSVHVTDYAFRRAQIDMKE
jgi:hypothetical protein